MDWTRVCLFGLLVHVATAEVSWVEADFEEIPHDRVLRSRRNAISKCGTDYIFDYSGATNGTNRTRLAYLMRQINIGNDDGKNKYLSCNKCLSSEAVFNLNGFRGNSVLSKSDFEKICPSLLQQLLSKSCNKNHDDHHHRKTKENASNAKAWGFGILSVTIISLASLLGAFVVPFMNKEFYKKLLLFLVSLAVGVLCGSGLFHLIPHAFGLGGDHDHHQGQRDDQNHDYSYLWKCSTIVGGIYFFFITENLMKIYIRFSNWKRTKISKQQRSGIQKQLIDEGKYFCVVFSQSENVHQEHALDSVHLTDQNCQHEHGIDSLNMTGDHCINKKNTSEYFQDSDSNKVGSIFERVAPVAWMIILGDGLHNFIDGLAIGVSFTNNVVQGVTTSLAILCEELPHELGDFAILLNSGMTYKQAMLANFFSACTCYVGLIIGIILGSTTQAVKWIYAVAAGMFLYISLVDMLPEATGMQVTISATSKRETVKNFIIVNFAMIFGYSLMLVLAIYGETIQL